jgi:hypothetical protein
MKTLLWGLMVLIMIIYFFAVLFVQVVTDHLFDKVELHPQEVKMQIFFGSLWSGMATLFMSVTGGLNWEIIVTSLRYIDPFAELPFFAFIALTQLAVLNILTSIFVENAVKVANGDRDAVIREHLSSEESFIEVMRDMFHEADTQQCLELTWDQFAKYLSDPRVKAMFTALDLQVTEAQGLFQLLDLDGNGVVDAEEFVLGCVRLKGGAKSVDTAMLLFENKRMFKKQASFMRYVDEQFKSIGNHDRLLEERLGQLLQQLGVSPEEDSVDVDESPRTQRRINTGEVEHHAMQVGISV